LREFRSELGISIRLAEERTGISRAYLSQIERGRLLPTDRQAKAIEEVYAAPRTEWYGRDGLLAIQADSA
jgi:transcriptional regulator with XRE-family HTH domain